MTDTRKIPTHEVTYARLRDMILFGLLEPGAPVTIQGLINDLGAGMTPVREALRRLAAEGALLPQGNRRVTVPRVSLAVLDQIAFARLTIEPHLAELAAAHLSPALIARLEGLDAQVDAAIRAGDITAYLKSNHAFHFALYEASNAPVLVDMARSLWLRFGPSLRIVVARGAALALPDQHGLALSAMRAGDGAGLVQALRDDILQGVDQVRSALARGEI
ncbi:MAG: GntR family transcriptional regulator [Pseudomonadota bacterium]